MSLSPIILNLQKKNCDVNAGILSCCSSTFRDNCLAYKLHAMCDIFKNLYSEKEPVY